MHLFLIRLGGWLRTVACPSMISLAQVVRPCSPVRIHTCSLSIVASCWGRRRYPLETLILILTLSLAAQHQRSPWTSLCLSFLSHGWACCLTQGLPHGNLVRTREIRKTGEPLAPRFSTLTICWNHFGRFFFKCLWPHLLTPNQLSQNLRHQYALRCLEALLEKEGQTHYCLGRIR